MKISFSTVLYIVLGVVILAVFYRNLPVIESSMEGMANNGTKTLRGTRCGTDLYPCPSPNRCANGMCISEDTTMPVEAHPLPVLP
jgi:hypothetical protein